MAIPWLVLLVVAGISMMSAAAYRVENAELFGRITAAQSGVPVVAATLVAEPLGVGTRTNPDGEFLMLGISPDSSPVHVRIQHPCFYTVIIEISLQENSAPLLLGLPPRIQEMEDSYCYRYTARY